MPASSSIIVLLLGFAALFVLLYYAQTVNTAADVIPTRPRISEEQAAMIVDDTLRNNLQNYTSFAIYVHGMGYIDYSEFKVREMQVPITFTHQNGTLFFINSTTYDVYHICTNTENTHCGYTQNYVNWSRDRLVYAFDLTYRTDSDCDELPDLLLVDAISGVLAFSFVTERSEILPRECLVQST